MSLQSSTAFSMGAALNKLRAIENGAISEKEDHYDPGMEDAGKGIDQANFTRTMARLNILKDAVTPEHFQSLRAGIRSLHMNRRPNMQQMSALMDLLETILGYVADDQTLFQRLKQDLKQDSINQTSNDLDKDEVSELPNNTEIEDDEDDSELTGDELRPLK